MQLITFIKKIIFLAITFPMGFLSIQAQTTDVLINEIAPDPGMYDGQGGEWIELYSASGQDISRYVLTDGEEIIIIPDGTIIPPNGLFLIYNSTFFNCAFCNWDPSIINNLPATTITLDIATCNCTNQEAKDCYAVTYENSGLPPSNNGSGERVVLFDENAHIIDAIYYGDGSRVNKGAAVPESQIANTDGAADIIIGFNIVGNSTHLGFTLPASNDYSIPAVTGDGTDNRVYTYSGLNPVSCSCSNARITDGGSSTDGDGFFSDLYPSPGLPNTTPDFVITYSTADGQTGTLTNEEQIVLDLCSATTISFQADIYAFNQVYNDTDGDDGGSVVPAGNGSFIKDTEGFINGQAAWTEAATTPEGITTLTYTTPAITGNTLIDFQIKENTQAAHFANKDQSCATGITNISGAGNGAQCYIRRAITVRQTKEITAINYTCVDGLITVTTTPATDFGSYELSLDNSSDDHLDRTFLINTSPFQFQISEGIETDYSLNIIANSQLPNCSTLPALSGQNICVFTPPCPTLGTYATCTDAEGAVCPNDNISISIDVNDATNLPNGAIIEYVALNAASATAEAIYASTEILATQTVHVSTITPKDCSNLSAGDIAFTHLQADTPDEFGFAILVSLAANTTICFTDNGITDVPGWRNSGLDGGVMGEGYLCWTSPNMVLEAGTIIELGVLSGSLTWSNTNTFATLGSITSFGDGASGDDNFRLTASGEQIFAYCGDAADFSSITFIAGMQSNSTTFQTTATTSTTSALPPGLTEGISAVALGASADAEDEFDNTYFNCTGGAISGNLTFLQNAFFNPANWTGRDDIQTPNVCTITNTDITTSLTTLSPSCASLPIPTDQCTKGDLFIAARISPNQEGCNRTTGGNSEFPISSIRTYSVSCPTATIAGEAAICAGSTASIPILFHNASDCSSADITYIIDGGSPVTIYNIAIHAGMATIPDLTTAGLYELTHITLNNCSSTLCHVAISGNYNLQVQTLPTTPIVADQIACNNQLSILMASGDAELVWYDGHPTSGGVQIGIGERIPVTLTAKTTYFVRSEISDNACVGEVVSFNISIADLPSAKAEDIAGCEGTKLDLVSSAMGGTGPYSFAWTTTNANNFLSTDQHPTVTQSATAAAAGTYTLIVEDDNGCFSADEAIITVSACTPACEANCDGITPWQGNND